MTMQPKSRAHRILKPLARYRSVEEITPDQPGPDRPALDAGEELLGFYEDPDGPVADLIAVTDRGLRVRRNGAWQGIAYGDIESVRGPSEKEGAASLTLNLHDGTSRLLHIHGGDRRFRDVFTFRRFLERVLSDARR